MTELFDRIGPLAALVASLDHPPALAAMAVLPLLLAFGLVLGRRGGAPLRYHPAGRWLMVGGALAAVGFGVLVVRRRTLAGGGR